jgi:hypothetical protein
MDSQTDGNPLMDNPFFPVPIRWNIPEIAKHSECGLSSVSVSTLQKCLQPVLEGLGQIDATELLGLEQVAAGMGPQIKEGYV